MGDIFGDGEAFELPVHQVCLSSFFIDLYEVTQAEYKTVIGTNPSYFQGASLPVEQVTWFNARDYCLAVGKRLPTEAEWEYAARSGGQIQKYSGTSSDVDIVNYAWYRINSGNTSHPIGQKLPNGLGLYDMTGNVFELVADWNVGDYYSGSPINNPQGPASGSEKVIRGGSWWSEPWDLRDTRRAGGFPDGSNETTGFRCVWTP
jgi:formylglycine-generating enzyme required for sulfatase activity